MTPEPTPRSLLDPPWLAERMEADRAASFAPLWSEATS